MDAIKTTGQVVYWLMVAVLIVVGAGVMLSVFDVPSGIKMYAVKSGSMEPAVGKGSLVVTRKSGEYKAGDIITFTKSAGNKETVTH